MMILGLITDNIASFFHGLTLGLVGGIYWLASKAFEIFSILASSNFFSNEKYQVLITNMYVILGIVMLFIIAFALLKSMVDPDGKNNTTEVTTKVISKLISSLIILVLLPTIFNFAFKLQDALIEQNSIGKLFGANSTYSDKSGKKTIKSGASSMSNEVFKAFFYPNMNNESCKGAKTIALCAKTIKGEDSDYESLLDSENYVSNTGEFSEYGNYAENITDDEVTFNWFLAFVAGIFVAYVVISFCFDLGLRVVKLVFYQIIAPIPVFFRIIPDSKLADTFNSWVKVTITCYLEVFVRLFAIYLGVFMFTLLPDVASGDFESSGLIVSALARAFLVMGIIMFIKEVPKLLAEVTGLDSSNMKLGIKSKLSSGGGLIAAGALGSYAATSAGIRAFKRNYSQRANETIGIKDGKTIKAGKVRAFASGIGGFTGAASRGFKSGIHAKGVKGASQSADNALGVASGKYESRANYRATGAAAHGGNMTLGSTIGAYASDYKANAQEWLSGDAAGLLAVNKVYDSFIAARKEAKNSAEGYAGKLESFDNNTLFNKAANAGSYNMTDSNGNIIKDAEGNDKKFFGYNDEMTFEENLERIKNKSQKHLVVSAKLSSMAKAEHQAALASGDTEKIQKAYSNMKTANKNLSDAIQMASIGQYKEIDTSKLFAKEDNADLKHKKGELLRADEIAYGTVFGSVGNIDNFDISGLDENDEAFVSNDFKIDAAGVYGGFNKAREIAASNISDSNLRAKGISDTSSISYESFKDTADYLNTVVQENQVKINQARKAQERKNAGSK